jgi:hypothetical protein
MESLQREEVFREGVEHALPVLTEVRHEPLMEARILRAEHPLGDGERVDQVPAKEVSAELTEALEAGAQKGRERIAELTPQSLADLRAAAHSEFGYAQIFAAVYADQIDGSEAQKQAYKTGMRSVVSAWYREQKPVMQIASELGQYAALQAPLPYVNAEAAIAQNFLTQLTSGRKTIDLSQRYATDDQSAAQARHEKALENLRPLIREAARMEGYKVVRGAAIADGLRQSEVLALRHGQKHSPGNL